MYHRRIGFIRELPTAFTDKTRRLKHGVALSTGRDGTGR